jgi:hypothetical protein
MFNATHSTTIPAATPCSTCFMLLWVHLINTTICSRVERSIGRIKEAAARGIAMREAAAARPATAAVNVADATAASAFATVSNTCQTASGHLRHFLYLNMSRYVSAHSVMSTDCILLAYPARGFWISGPGVQLFAGPQPPCATQLLANAAGPSMMVSPVALHTAIALPTGLQAPLPTSAGRSAAEAAPVQAAVVVAESAPDAAAEVPAGMTPATFAAAQVRIS